MKKFSVILIAIVFIAAGAGPLSAGGDAFATGEPSQVDGVTEIADQAEPAEGEAPAWQDEQAETVTPAVESEAAQEANAVPGSEQFVMKAQQDDPAVSPKAVQPAESRAAVSTLERPVIASLIGIKYKSICIRWKADVNADGYEIYYKTGKKKKKIVKTTATGKYVLKKLKKGKKYKIKIRSYRVQNGKTIRSKWSKAKKVKAKYTDWIGILEKYRQNDTVKELIFVKYKSGSTAQLYLYKKDASRNWNQVLNCKAYIGKNGLNKEKEGDKKTPVGDFPITHAFGIKDDPGSAMNYLKVNKNHYWCADKYYNQLVDVSKQKHNCKGEHLIDYTKQYAYAMNIGYNIEGTPGKGSAIFLHCFGNCTYTLGCVAVSQENMIKILQTCEPGTRICIYRE